MIYFVGSPRIPTDNSYMPTSFDHFINYFQNKKVIGLDTETTGFDPHTCNLICVQFGDYDNQFVIEVTEPSIVENLRFILEDSSRQFLLQNAKFDLRFFLKHNINIPNVYDTFLAELILQTGIERENQHVALDDIVWKYCNIKLDKTIRGNINREGLTPRVIRYAADDVKYLHIVKEKQLEQITKLGLDTVLDLENQVTRVFARMEYDGVLIDQVKWLEVAKITDEGKKTLEQELDIMVQKEPKLQRFVPKAIQGNLFGFEERNMALNWGSSQQKLDVLKALGIDAISTGDRVLQKNKHVHPLISKLIAYNKQKKLNDAFGKKFLDYINPTTNRVHTEIWPIVSSGRVATSAPNVLQIPSKGELAKIIRSCFIPKSGYKIVGGDYSGFELRLIAEFSQDPVWVQAFIEGKDLHSELAAKTFGIELGKVKDPFPPKPDMTYRDVQKIVNFMLAYGGSAFKLADTIQVSKEEADSIINKFFSVVPKVKEFLEHVGNLGKSRGFIKSGPPFNRIRWFPEWEQTKDLANPNRFKILGEIERASKNYPFQSSNANIIKLALINAQNEIDTNKWPVSILLSIYDEIETECKEDKAEEWCTKLEQIMIESARVVIKTVPIKADCKISPYWTK